MFAVKGYDILKPKKNIIERTRRVSITFPPELFDKLSSFAKLKDSNINDVVNAMAADLVQKNSAAINKFEQVKQEVEKETTFSLFADDSAKTETTTDDNSN